MENDVLEKILQVLDKKERMTSLEMADILNIPHATLVGQLNSLKSRGEIIDLVARGHTSWELTEEGKWVYENGSYESLVFNYLKEKGPTPLAELMKIVTNSKIGFSKAMANGWVKKEANNLVSVAVDEISDDVQRYLTQIYAKEFSLVPDEKKSEFKKRKLMKEITLTVFDIDKGVDFSVALQQPETDLTSEMIEDGSWKTKTFKNYNFDALGTVITCGALHPLMKVREEFRRIFIEMGFSEMNTSNYVESSFWNFDSLFQPQQHPARDAHDTFFLTHPVNANMEHVSQIYINEVSKAHSSGSYGSIGYKYTWMLNEARKNLLRTHTTANSARYLFNKSTKEGKEFQPVKMFSVDKVFRNETLDATHLAEFHQVEGLVADYNLTLSNLIGVIHNFFEKLGITKLQFKPAYNPYTEPSMEIFCFHPGLGKWIEVGNSGMFRPEMLLPMGLPEGVNVIAWGLSLERPAMIKFKLNNIRDLVGPKVQISMVEESPIVNWSE